HSFKQAHRLRRWVFSEWHRLASDAIMELTPLMLGCLSLQCLLQFLFRDAEQPTLRGFVVMIVLVLGMLVIARGRFWFVFVSLQGVTVIVRAVFDGVVQGVDIRR